MKRIPQGRYTKEFRAEAVKLVIKQGFSIPETSFFAGFLGKSGA
jgi:transposase-like protein